MKEKRIKPSGVYSVCFSRYTSVLRQHLKSFIEVHIIENVLLLLFLSVVSILDVVVKTRSAGICSRPENVFKRFVLGRLLTVEWDLG